MQWPSAVVESRSILTSLINYNCLQKSHSLLKAQWSVKLILGHLNIDAIQDRFEALKFTIDYNIDIFLGWETKLDSFPTAQFLIKGFTVPYRLDRNSKRGLLSYISVTIYRLRFWRTVLILILKLRKRKWLLNDSYNPNKNQVSNYLEYLNRLLEE